MHPILKTLCGAIGFVLASCACAEPTLVQDVRVFDGEHVHARRSVLFDQGVIVDADYRGAAPAGTRIVSGQGHTLLPGLIDAHTHAWRYHELPVLFGVTTQIDMFTQVSMLKEAKASRRAGRADLFSAGTLVTAPGGNGTQFGVAIPTLARAEDAQAFVDARIAEGSDFIKIVMVGTGATALDLPRVKAVIDAAHRRGKLAVVHVNTEQNARAVIEAGVDGLTHLFTGETIDAAGLAQLAARHGAFVIPTFTVLESEAAVQVEDLLADPSFASLLDKEMQSLLKARYGAAPRPARLAAPKALTTALHKAGVPVLAGTDAGNAGTQHGASMHRELAALVEAGLAPRAALAAATSLPAKVFRLGQRGRIDKGYKADLLLVEGDPSVDIRATRRIVEVWKDGESANGLREEQRKLVAQRAEVLKTAIALPAAGRIGGFGDKNLKGAFGAGWMPSTDSFTGGKSTVSLTAQSALPDGQVPLEVIAKVAPELPYAWAGVAFMPGAQPMQPANLSTATLLRFKVRGDGKTYQAIAMSQGVQAPRARSFTAGPEWTEVTIPLAEFKGLDTAAITMLGFNAGPQPGDYRFEIADVRLLER